MRVVFMSAGGLGHLHPLIPLARAAEAAGDDVLFAVAAEAVAPITSFGFATTVIPYGDPADLARAWAGLPDRDLNTYVVAEIFLRLQGRAAQPAQRAAIKDFAADLVISSELGALVAAEASSTPSAYLGITALDLDDLKLSVVTDAVDDLREAAGLPRTRTLPFHAGSRYLSPVPPVLWADPAPLPADWIWYRHEDAEGPAPAPHSRPAGDRPQIYVTLGSMAGGNDFGRPMFRPMLEALEQVAADVLFTIGPFDKSQLGPVPDNVTVVEYAPQATAMDCDAAVIHAGSGTTVAALTRGLPLVAVPMFADQMHNADRLVAAGVGVRVDPDQVPGSLAPAVARVLSDAGYRANARRIAAEIDARPTPAEALAEIRPS